MEMEMSACLIIIIVTLEHKSMYHVDDVVLMHRVWLKFQLARCENILKLDPLSDVSLSCRF